MVTRADGTVIMKDEQYKGGVSISKQVLGQGKELEGAVLTVEQTFKIKSELLEQMSMEQLK